MTVQSATLLVDLKATLQSVLDLTRVSAPLEFRRNQGFGSADEMFSDQRTLSASATENLDMAGSLTNAIGSTVTFARIFAILIYASPGNTNDVVVGGAASNAFATPFADSTDKIVLRPGGILLLTAPDSTGYVVTAGTGDILLMANSAGGTSVTYDIILLGATS